VRNGIACYGLELHAHWVKAWVAIVAQQRWKGPSEPGVVLSAVLGKREGRLAIGA
jgi:predicted hotdog family 3-hydroxylacyl-ACP dehydratase